MFGNTTKRCWSYGISLIDTPLTIPHVKITLSSKTPKSEFENMVSLDSSVLHVRIE